MDSDDVVPRSGERRQAQTGSGADEPFDSEGARKNEASPHAYSYGPGQSVVVSEEAP